MFGQVFVKDISPLLKISTQTFPLNYKYIYIVYILLKLMM